VVFLLCEAVIVGVRRGKRVRTTKADPGAPRYADLAGRNFTNQR
jgi:putative transposase